jgi:DNA-binding transcriptional ArsR family regulator
MTKGGVLVLEPGDERAKKIGKAMASGTASDILSALSEDEFTLSELSECLGQPITTLKYQIENLLDAGLVDIVRTRYSEKGRVIKVYGVRQQVVIMSPGKANLRDLLLKYTSLFTLIICATLVLLALAPTFAFLPDDGSIRSGVDMASGDTRALIMTCSPEDAETGANGENGGAVSTSAPDSVAGPMGREDTPPPQVAPNILAVTFFAGGFVVIFLMLMLEMVAMYRRQ